MGAAVLTGAVVAVTGGSVTVVVCGVSPGGSVTGEITVFAPSSSSYPSVNGLSPQAERSAVSKNSESKQKSSRG